MAYAPVNGIQLYYREYGRGLPLLLVHGNGSNHLTWCFQIAFFSRWFRVITPDVRGFGNSVDLPGGPSVGAAADDLAGLLDHLRIEQAVVVGHSLGGRIALAFALQFPQRTQSLVMVDAVGGIHIPGPYNDRMAEARKAVMALPAAERYLAPAFVEREPALTLVHMELGTLNAGHPRRAGGFPPAVPVGAADLDRLGRHLAVQWIVGEHDPWSPPDVVHMAHKMTPGSAFVLMPGAGHSTYFEQPDAFNQAMFSFLQAHNLVHEPTAD